MKGSFFRSIAGAALCAVVLLALLAAGQAKKQAVDPAALQSGARQIMEDAKEEGVSAAGARAEQIPGTESQAVVSFGSADVKKDADGNSTPQDKLVDQRKSRIQADAVLAAFVSSMKGTVKGFLPPGVDSSSWTSEDGRSVSVNVYTPELSKHLKVKPATSSAAAGDSAPAASDAAEPESSQAPAADEVPAAKSEDLYPELRQIDFDEAMISRVDWEQGFVEISGEGAAPAGKSAPQGRLLARRAAMADMQRKYIEFLQGAVVQSATAMKDFEVQNERVSSEVRGIARNVAVSDEKWDGRIFTVTGRMQLQDVQRFLKDLRLYVKQK